jgi:glycosyltransferase involved in cell wall biosynthesis
MAPVTPLVSVLVSTYDGADHVAEAIASLQGQAGVELEVVVTDDGSRDRTPDLVAALAADDPRIHLAVVAHAGIAATRNRGLARARGDYVTFLDQDDLCPRGTIARHLERLESDRAATAIFGLMRAFTAGEEPSPPRRTMLLSAALLRREAFGTVGSFDERFTLGDDFDWLLRLLETGRPILLDDAPATLHRRHRGQATGDVTTVRSEQLRALGASLRRRRAAGLAGPLQHPLVAAGVGGT